MTRTPALDTALAYAAQDLRVVPLWGVDHSGDCNCGGTEFCHPGKHPIGALAPRGHRSATTDPEKLTDWFTKIPDANVGLELEQSGLVATDVDLRAGGEESDVSLILRHGAWPDTWTHQTGNGWHQLFVRPIGGLIAPKTIAPGIDLMTSGYIVAPPSIHENGTHYIWDVNANPLEGHPLFQVPDWLISEINRGDTNSVSEQRVQRLDCEVRRVAEPSARFTNRILTNRSFADIWKKQNPSAKRTDLSDSGWCFSLALKLYWKRFSDQEVCDALVCYRDHIGAQQKPEGWFLRTCSNAKNEYLKARYRFSQARAG